jgi:hypothetical protein
VKAVKDSRPLLVPKALRVAERVVATFNTSKRRTPVAPREG